MSSYQQSEIDKSLLAAELCSPLPTARKLFTYAMNAIAFAATGLALIPLLSILWEIPKRGIPGLKPDLFFNPVIDYGFGNAITGSITIVAIGSLLSIPVGILTGIFLAEFNQNSPLSHFVRFIAKIMTGVPSIIVGMFAYGVIVLVTKGFSAIAGGFALAVLILPIVILTTEAALKLVPIDQRLAAAALGSTRFQTTLRIVVNSAIPGITTGILLGVARASGETAPLIFTALSSLDWSSGLLSPTASLPVLIFNLYNDPDPQKSQLVWTAAMVLLSLVFCISLFSRLVISKSKIK
ncbi:phosphate ABC transporter permease PstA [Fortiea sp. LEGE XX443]|uniref:phosphate ABC transporter permease PstA n=1 Tax=Fortiea sp. LEGE XX443 TaxID=1828611 RepID=UPI00187F350D|nr:phosphate ABC transporter permease PstA [Fortiea sp. LEGE XX443]MBE9007501.1 phosphate ABC transporter permease PstA [Fortiea sp. LEGE XX443]